MGFIKKYKKIMLVSVLFIFILVFILLLRNNNLKKIKGDVSNFTPQANYDLSTNNNIDPTTWVAVDNLGRTVPSQGESFNSREVGKKDTTGKQVGLFYHNWHNVVRHDTYDAYVIPQIWNSIGDPNNKLFASWSDKGTIGSLWWGEPVYGFYNPKDKYVVRKQIELIADAGVDFIVLDYTNWNVLYDKNGKNVNKKDAYAATGDELSNSVFPDELTVLFTVLDEAKEDGIKTPKVTFMLSHLACDRSECGEDGDKVVLPPESPFYGIMPTYNEQTRNIVQWLWDNVYNNGNYKEHLLYGGGNKPIILAQHPSDTTWKPDKYHSSITDSSAHWRFMGNQYENASTNSSGYDWSWIDKYPQTIYTFNNEIPVSPAQHTIKTQGIGAIPFSAADTRGIKILGRSNCVSNSEECDYAYTFQYRNKKYNVGNAFQLVPGTGVGTLYGRNFQQQWDYAIDNNPKFVMVTGWNEYLAGSGNDGGYINFVDQYNDEYSRDLEPVKGSLKDSYYYQLVTNVRLYKGANSQAAQSTSKSIDIYGDPNQWNDSNLVDYNSYTNTKSKERNVNNNKWGYRNDPSFSSNVETLTSAPVVNDIRTAKVSYDASYIYFYLETVGNIDYKKIDKLRLLIDTLDARTSTSTANWNEFEYVLNRNGATPSTLLLEKVKTGCKNDALPSESNSTCAYTQVGNVNYKIVSNTMQVSIPRSMLGLTSTNINFNFKWTDNNLDKLDNMYDIMSVYTDGDAAPGGRFAFKFSGSEPYSVPKAYTVKFNANGGTGGQSANVSATYGSAMPTISTTRPTRAGYTFMGWYDNATYTSGTQYYTASGASARSFNKTTTTTLYAGWKANTYTVKFNANGGSGGQSADVTATYGSAMPTISTTKPTKQGYTFMGWYDNATYTSGTQYYTASGASARSFNKTSTTTLYAGWKANTYTVKFNANGGSGGQSESVTATYGSAMPTISTTKPTKQGYTFMGWYDNATYTSGTQYYKASGASARSFNKTSTTTLYAGWKANTYTVKFNANGGSGGQSENVTATYGSAMPTISTTKPTKQGYTFMGWYDNATYTSGTQYYKASGASARSFNKTSTTTLYAGWSINSYTITYDANGGSGEPSAQIYTYSASESIYLSSTKPTRTGYIFLGWSLTSTATTPSYSAGQAWRRSNTDNYTLYAVWEKAENIIDISNLFIEEDVIILNKNSTLNTIYEIINNDHGITIYDNNQVVDLNTILKTNNELHVNNKVYYIAILGDVKADEIIDIRDVTKAYDALANGNYIEYTKAEKYALDINCDGKKSILDLIRIYDAIEH